MTDFSPYRSKKIVEMRPYVPGQDMTGISVFSDDRDKGCPRAGDMIARRQEQPGACWLMSKEYFDENFEPA